MNRDRLQVSAAAALLICFAYYIGRTGELLALLLPVLAHELGHIATLRLMGLRITRMRAELRGLCIEYSGRRGSAGELLAALAGPAAGLLYALTASAAGGLTGLSWLRLTAGVSLLLSVFNLLPAMPLDGGRAFAVLMSALMGGERGERLACAVSFAVACLIMAAGLWMCLSGRGAAPLGAGLWLMLYQWEDRGLEKSRGIL